MSEQIKLDLSTNGDCIFRTGDAPRIFQYRGFSYEADSTDSFCRLLKAKAANIPAAVVFVNDIGFRAIVDTTVEERPQDKITYKYAFSILAQEWLDVLKGGRIFSIKEMVDFLKRREEGEIVDSEKLMTAAQNFKYVVKTEGDFTRQDNQNYVMAIKVGEAEGTVTVPERFYANLELIEGSGFTQTMEIEIEIHRPKNEQDGKPAFLLSCPKFDRYYDKAKRNEIAKLEHELSEFLVVTGQPEDREK